MLNLSNKKIIITGAASGIGKAIAAQSVDCGAIVIAVDIDSDGLERLEKEKGKNNIIPFVFDASKMEQVELFFSEIEGYTGYPDCLINNVGIYYGKSILDYTQEEIDRVLEVNIKYAVYFSKKFAQYKMRNKEHGCIINMSSVSGQESSSDAIYGLSKAALIGLTKSNAMNFSPYVRVNAIAPGIIDTPMMKTISSSRLAQYRERELISEPLTPEQVANTAIFLISDAAKHYTGAVFDINNGCYLR